MAIEVSVVVPTYKRPELLRRCLSALMAQHFDPDAYEIIIADDAEGNGPAAARNCGWRAAKGSIIAFTDDDCIPDPDWLSAGVKAFHEGVACVKGKLIMPLPENPTDYQWSASWLAEAEFVTANCFCRREVLEAVGGFDERFTKAWREDSDLFFTLMESGYRVVFEPEAKVVHPIRPAPWGVSLKLLKNNLFEALLWKKHPDLYRQKIQSGFLPLYYFLLFLIFLFVWAMFNGNYFLQMGTGILWLALTGYFCLYRLRHTSRHFSHIAEMAVTSALIPPLAIYWRIAGALRFGTFFL